MSVALCKKQQIKEKRCKYSEREKSIKNSKQKPPKHSIYGTYQDCNNYGRISFLKWNSFHFCHESVTASFFSVLKQDQNICTADSNWNYTILPLHKVHMLATFLYLVFLTVTWQCILSGSVCLDPNSSLQWLRNLNTGV